MTIFTKRTGATAHPEGSVLQLDTDIISVAGVLDLSATNHFKVAQQTSPDMTVKVAAGRAYVKSATSNGYPVRSDADANVTITANGSGNPRKDAIVLYIDLAASPNSDASNVAKLAAVAGTASASPQPPDDAAIGTAIGASNPFIRLANVTVISGETTIENADIEDKRAQVALKLMATDWTAFTPSISGSGGSAGTYAQDLVLARYCVIGKLCHLNLSLRITDKGSWSGDLRVNYPIPASANLSDKSYFPIFIASQSTNPITAAKGIAVASNVNTYFNFKNSVNASFLQWSGISANDTIFGQGFYEID